MSVTATAAAFTDTAQAQASVTASTTQITLKGVDQGAGDPPVLLLAGEWDLDGVIRPGKYSKQTFTLENTGTQDVAITIPGSPTVDATDGTGAPVAAASSLASQMNVAMYATAPTPIALVGSAGPAADGGRDIPGATLSTLTYTGTDWVVPAGSTQTVTVTLLASPTMPFTFQGARANVTIPLVATGL